MKKILVLAFKDWLLLWRDKISFFWILGFPLVIALFFGSVMMSQSEGGISKLPVALVNDDGSEMSREFIDKLRRDPSLKVEVMDLKKAQAAVRKGKKVAFVLIEADFGKGFEVFFQEKLPLKMGIDPSRKAEASYLRGVLTKASFEMTQSLFSDSKKMKKFVKKSKKDILADSEISLVEQQILLGLMENLEKLSALGTNSGLSSPMRMGEISSLSLTRKRQGPLSPFDVSFPAALLWAVMGCAAGFAISLVKERVGGTFLRLQMSPLNRIEILAGKGLSCFFGSLVVMAFLLAIGVVFCGVNVGSYPALMAAMLSTALCFVGIMMFISVLGKSEEAAAGGGWAILLIMSMLGGGMVPLIAMPQWMLKVSHFSPVKWGIISLEGAIWRGFSWSEMALPCGILLATGMGFFLLGLSLFSRTGK